MPLAGSAIAIFFYEYVFIKSREYLDDDDEPETGSDKNEFSALNDDEIIKSPNENASLENVKKR